MPRYIGRNLRLTEAIQNFIGARELRKKRRSDDIRDQFAQTMAEKRFQQGQEQIGIARGRLSLAEDAARQPTLVGGQQTGFYERTPGEPLGTGPFTEEQQQPSYRQVIAPAEDEDQPDFRSVNIGGQGYTFNPDTGEYELKVKKKYKSPPKLSKQEMDLFNNIYKGTRDPESPSYGKDPFQEFDFTRRRLGIGGGPERDLPRSLPGEGPPQQQLQPQPQPQIQPQLQDQPSQNPDAEYRQLKTENDLLLNRGEITQEQHDQYERDLNAHYRK